MVEQIVARTDGVPLFVEELTKTILESDLLVDAGDRYILTGPLPALAIPTTLHDSLMARLDKLAPVKEVAQLAAALGRVFSHELLAALSPLGQAALEQALSELVEAELLFRRGSMPEVTYEFKHALLQDAAYGSLLRAKRQQLHARIAQVLEERFPHTAEAKPELLAHHFREAGLPERAIPYAFKAGDAAVARYASAEARTRYGAALDMARALPPSETASRGRISAVLKLAGVSANRDHFEHDLRNLAEARALAEELGDDAALSEIEYWFGRTNYVLGHFDAAVEHARIALALAETQGGDTAGALPINLLARIHCLRGEAPEAIAFAARNVEQMRRVGNRVEEAAISGVLAFAYGLHGDFAEAFAAAAHGIALARRLEHLPTLAACLHFRGVAKGWHGEIDDSVADFEEALFCAQQSGDMFRQYLIYGWRGEAHLLVGRVGAAEADLQRCLALGEQIGTTFHRGAFQAFLARIRLLQGDLASALQTSDQALEIATDTAQPWSRSIALRVCAEILLASDPADVANAEQAVRAAIEIQEKRECRCDLAASEVVLSAVLAARGHHGAGTAANGPLRSTRRWASHRASPTHAPRWPQPDFGRLESTPAQLSIVNLAAAVPRLASALIAPVCWASVGRAAMANALLLGGGAPTLTLQSGALAALDEKGAEFAAISTAGAGMVIGLLYAAPKGMTRQEALQNTVNMGVADEIYNAFPVNYKVFFKPGDMADIYRRFLAGLPPMPVPTTPADRLWSDWMALVAATLSPSNLTPDSLGLCAPAPWIDHVVDFDKLQAVRKRVLHQRLQRDRSPDGDLRQGTDHPGSFPRRPRLSVHLSALPDEREVLRRGLGNRHALLQGAAELPQAPAGGGGEPARRRPAAAAARPAEEPDRVRHPLERPDHPHAADALRGVDPVDHDSPGRDRQGRYRAVRPQIPQELGRRAAADPLRRSRGSLASGTGLVV